MEETRICPECNKKIEKISDCLPEFDLVKGDLLFHSECYRKPGRGGSYPFGSSPLAAWYIYAYGILVSIIGELIVIWIYLQQKIDFFALVLMSIIIFIGTYTCFGKMMITRRYDRLLNEEKETEWNRKWEPKYGKLKK